MTRHDGRSPDHLREVRITRNWLDHAEGSVLVEFGRTRVLCAASFTAGVPRWLKGKGTGWVTSEYEMLPRSTNTRSDRESRKGRVGGRTHEISRLIGRSLRAIIDTKALGENTIVLDCDVLQADGGTRTAAITGAYVALVDAIEDARAKSLLPASAKPLTGSIAAVSVGIVDGEAVLDLDYPEDVGAGTDMNVVMTGDGEFVEVQGTAEGKPFDRDLLNALLDLAAKGCADLSAMQQAALADAVADAREKGLVVAGAEPLTGSIAAVSVGLVAGRPVLDLDYPEDSTAQTDMNVVMTGDGRFVEVQGTAEGAGAAFDRTVLGDLLDLATTGCEQLSRLQQEALAAPVRERLA